MFYLDATKTILEAHILIYKNSDIEKRLAKIASKNQKECFG